ncbi:MAG: signal peptidase II [Candidatus Omnitrophica bacterium]|nr:signal peptidase II [Candidatus Omnitrophota bacterium]
MLFIPILFILALDQFTKYLVTKSLILHESFPVIKGIFHLTLVANRGAAFGILKDQTLVFIFTAILVIILISVHLSPIFSKGLRKDKGKHGVYRIAMAFILSGALGNLIDRLRFGYVIDFLDLRIWPVFNLADCAITLGAILLGWSIIFKKIHPHNL